MTATYVLMVGTAGVILCVLGWAIHQGMLRLIARRAVAVTEWQDRPDDMGDLIEAVRESNPLPRRREWNTRGVDDILLTHERLDDEESNEDAADILLWASEMDYPKVRRLRDKLSERAS